MKKQTKRTTKPTEQQKSEAQIIVQNCTFNGNTDDSKTRMLLAEAILVLAKDVNKPEQSMLTINSPSVTP